MEIDIKQDNMCRGVGAKYRYEGLFVGDRFDHGENSEKSGFQNIMTKNVSIFCRLLYRQSTLKA
jgi:hypothetical protein